jgi:hypothetical protein
MPCKCIEIELKPCGCPVGTECEHDKLNVAGIDDAIIIAVGELTKQFGAITGMFTGKKAIREWHKGQIDALYKQRDAVNTKINGLNKLLDIKEKEINEKKATKEIIINARTTQLSQDYQDYSKKIKNTKILLFVSTPILLTTAVILIVKSRKK